MAGVNCKCPGIIMCNCQDFCIISETQLQGIYPFTVSKHEIIVLLLCGQVWEWRWEERSETQWLHYQLSESKEIVLSKIRSGHETLMSDSLSFLRVQNYE